MFCDDTSISWKDKNVTKLSSIISDDLKLVKQWCDANRLVFNTGKTKVLQFNCDLDNLYLNNITINTSEATKFLGVLVDKQLRFEDHILELGKKLFSGCFAVRMVGQQMARIVYFALIESHLRYGIPFWGSSSQYLQNMIFVLQKKAIRFIANVDQRTSCKPFFINLQILTLPCLYILKTASLIFKNKPSSSKSYQPARVTRQNNNLPLPIPTRETIRRSIIYGGIKIFNHLPNSIKLASTPIQFRKNLKKFLLPKAYNSLNEFF